MWRIAYSQARHGVCTMGLSAAALGSGLSDSTQTVIEDSAQRPLRLGII